MGLEPKFSVISVGLRDLVACDRWVKKNRHGKDIFTHSCRGRYGDAPDNSHEPAWLKMGRTRI